MAIFGKSKKNQATTSPPQQFYPDFNSQPAFQGPYGDESQSNHGYINQRPSTSHGHGRPQGWAASSPPYQPIYVTQNYILPPKPHQTSKSTGAISRLNLGSVGDLLATDLTPAIPCVKKFNDGLSTWQRQGTQYLNQGAALVDSISSKFDAIITQIDGERFSGDEQELVIYEQTSPMWQQERSFTEAQHAKGKSKGMVDRSMSSALVSTNYFAKVHLYANSRLPPDLPPMKLYMPTFPLLCLAAQYSERVYTRPAGQEKEAHVEADWKTGTKAMVIKSVPMDDMNTIVFAIRGTQTFMDWAVNLNSAPASPDGFLDDPGNFCHAGFLTVAKKMIKPVALRLRNLLQEDPSRSSCSLLITGHSAGGAVAALLYTHMLSTGPEAQSELNILTGCFKRIHCVTFGAPPVSLLPLTKPTCPSLRKSIFLSFVNEGDPVPRADKAYVRSLLDLYSSPAPGQSCLSNLAPQKLQPLLGKSSSSLTLSKPLKKERSSSAPVPKLPPRSLSADMPLWHVPDATLSNAGRLVLLRGVERYTGGKRPARERMDEGVVAQMVSDDLLRGVVWGDPVCHMMRLYARRIEVLATNAVMGR